MRVKFLRLASTVMLAFAISFVPSFAQKKGDATKADTAKKASATPAASDADIQAAKKDGKVWVNTSNGVYHKGGRWYGKTKQGKFMTEDDAKKAGYHEDKGEAGKKK